MNKIFIKNISIKNFGGIANGEYSFSEGANIIEGSSGSGKTSAYLAYLWALGFTVPSWEPQIDGYRISKLKTEVEITLDVDGKEYKIGKTNASKYKINKFTAEEEYAGTNFKYLFDGAEQDKLETYREKIAELFGIDYFTLELVSTIALFNGEDGKRWDKNERRKFLFKLFDLENKIAELGTSEEFNCLREYLEKGKDELEINQILNTLNTSITREINETQLIMQEKQSELSNYSAIDFDTIEKRKEEISKELELLYTSEKEGIQNTIYAEKKKKLDELSLSLNEIKLSNENIKRDYEYRLKSLESKLSGLQDTEIPFSENKIKNIDTELEDLKIELEEALLETFDETNLICPRCKQTLPNEEIDKLRKEFDLRCQENVFRIKEKAKNRASALEESRTRLNTLLEQREAIKGQISQIQEEGIEVKDTLSLEQEIEKLKLEISNIKNIDTQEETKSKIVELKQEYERVIGELSKKERLNEIVSRIEELKNRVRELGIQDSQRIEKKNALQKYTKKKVELVNNEVNKNFTGVHYNFFKWNSSSASKDYIDICEAVLSETGTEYSSLSSGQQVKVDLFTVNSLRKILSLNIPQFVDDCVLSDFEHNNSEWQTIYLITKNDTKPNNLLLIKDCYTLKDCDVRK